MSPRGVATPDVRHRLIHAAERVLMRDGPDGVTARAVTKEAGTATGVLYVHFADLDEFLAEVALERWRLVAASVADLPERAGSATVTENLSDAISRLLESPVFAVMRLVLSRQAVQSRLMAARQVNARPALGQVEDAITRYLEEERKVGRVAESADPGAAAILLVGAMFHLLMHHVPDPSESDQRRRELARRIVAGLEVGLAP